MSTINIETKQRSLSIDMVKGLSIMTLFFLHFENGWMHPEYNFFIVRSPAFFIIVGWLWGMSSNKKTLCGHWAKRKDGLVKPYLWFSLIFLSFDAIMVIIGQYDLTILGRDLFKTISLRGVGTLWFLPALLGGEMLFIYLRDKYLALKVLSFITCFTIILLFNLYADSIFADCPIANFAAKCIFRVFKDICDAYIYISIAFYISNKCGKIIFNLPRKPLFLAGVILLLISFVCFNYNVIYNIQMALIPKTAIFIFASSSAGLGILLFFKSIEWFKPISLPLSYFGRNSLTIMAFHFCLLFQIVLIADKNIFGYTNYYGERSIIYFFVAMILQIAIIEVINKRFKFIIGKG